VKGKRKSKKEEQKELLLSTQSRMISTFPLFTQGEQRSIGYSDFINQRKGGEKNGSFNNYDVISTDAAGFSRDYAGQ
jgi:hypothetical protein